MKPEQQTLKKEYIFKRIYIDYVKNKVLIWNSQKDMKTEGTEPTKIITYEQFLKQYKTEL